MNQLTPIGPTSVIFYKPTADWTQNIVCTLDIKVGKPVEKYTT